jgi:hypothetical protein
MTERLSWQQAWVDNPDLNFVGIWKVGPHQPARVLLRYDEAWRPIFWLEFGSDGSIYLGPRYARLGPATKVTTFGPIRSLSIDPDQGERVPVESLKGGRITFHPSGLINLGDERLWRPPLRELTAQERLCAVRFEHPSAFEPVEDVRKRDICLPYPIDESRPLVGYASVAGAGHLVIEPLRTTPKQAILNIECGGFTETPDLVFQIVLHDGPVRNWPRFSAVFVEDDESLGQP